MKHVGTLLALVLWSQSSWAGQIELRTTRRIQVARTNRRYHEFCGIDSSRRRAKCVNDGDVAPCLNLDVLIELVGQTKGPLRWFEGLSGHGSLHANGLAGTGQCVHAGGNG